jgi:putative FmdB family regulatory protein
MPTYHYRCTQCGHEFEEFQKITDEPLSKCPKCGGLPQRLISGGAGLLFKGEGFYITDNRSEGYKKAANKESPKSEGSESKPGPAKPKSGGTSSGDS